MKIPRVSEVFRIPPVSEVFAAIFRTRRQAEPESGRSSDGPCVGRPSGPLVLDSRGQAYPEPEGRVIAEPEPEAEP
jgi:hypothetical protein